jgi:hypothetical protein
MTWRNGWCGLSKWPVLSEKKAGSVMERQEIFVAFALSAAYTCGLRILKKAKTSSGVSAWLLKRSQRIEQIAEGHEATSRVF